MVKRVLAREHGHFPRWSRADGLVHAPDGATQGHPRRRSSHADRNRAVTSHGMRLLLCPPLISQTRSRWPGISTAATAYWPCTQRSHPRIAVATSSLVSQNVDAGVLCGRMRVARRANSLLVKMGRRIMTDRITSCLLVLVGLGVIACFAVKVPLHLRMPSPPLARTRTSILPSPSPAPPSCCRGLRRSLSIHRPRPS